MARKKNDETQAAAIQDEVKDKADLLALASGEPPTEDAEAAFVKTRTAERFFRCGLEFGRLWRLVERKDLSEADWQHLLAEPHLVVEGVVLTEEEPAS